MKVLMFGWEFPPHIAGGLGTAVDTVSTTVDEFLGKVQFVHIGSNMVPYVDPQDFTTMVEEERKRQIKGFRVQYGQKYKFSGKYGANLMEEVARYAMVGATIAMQRKDEFDVIHAHDWLTYLAGIAAKQLTGKPLVIHVHATSFDRASDDKIDTRVFDLEKRGMEAADKVIAVSELTRNIVINRYGIDPDKVVAVHNAVDFSGRENLEVERNVKDKVVTFLGRVTYQKGPEYFIEAAAKVLKRCNNVRFVMAGSGDMLNRCIRHVARLGISDRFHFTGFLRGVEVQKMFALSDVYVMPSISEPFGISPLEAMQTNVPSIISKQSGCAEILNYALKVDFWDVDAMSDAIYGLLNYPAISALAARCGYEEVNSLKWNNAAAKVKAVYESVIKK